MVVDDCMSSLISTHASPRFARALANYVITKLMEAFVVIERSVTQIDKGKTKIA